MFGPIATPTIIDVEASGFGPQGYPIEVGVALASGATHCYLVLPRADWTYWDKAAEQVHHITRDSLEAYGRPLEEIAHALNAVIDTNTAFSDGWEVDSPWLNQLFYSAGIAPRFRLSALDYILSEAQMSLWHETKAQIIAEMDIKRHRASLDALIIQKTYERTARQTGRSSN